MVKLLEQFKVFTGKGITIGAEMTDWLQDDPSIIVCSIDYQADKLVSRVFVIYVQDATRAAHRLDNMEFTEIYADKAERTGYNGATVTELFEQRLNSWRKTNPTQAILTIQTSFDTKDEIMSALILHADEFKRKSVDQDTTIIE